MGGYLIEDRRPRVPLWVVGLLSVTGVLALFGALALDVTRSEREREAAVAWQTHSYQVIIAANELLSALQSAETGQRGYLLTGDPAFRAPYDRGRAAIAGNLAALRDRLARDPVQAPRFMIIQRLANDRAAKLDRGVAMIQRGEAAQAMALMRTGAGQQIMDAFRREVAGLKATETRLLAARSKAAAERGDAARAGLIGAAAVGLMLNLVALMLGVSLVRARIADLLAQTGRAAPPAGAPASRPDRAPAAVREPAIA